MKEAERETIVDAARRLTALVADPQPGLMTWHAACESVFQELVNAGKPILVNELNHTEELRAEATSRCADLVCELAEANRALANSTLRVERMKDALELIKLMALHPKAASNGVAAPDLKKICEAATEAMDGDAD